MGLDILLQECDPHTIFSYNIEERKTITALSSIHELFRKENSRGSWPSCLSSKQPGLPAFFLLWNQCWELRLVPKIRKQSGNLGPREAQRLKSKSQSYLFSWVLLFLPPFSTLGSLLVQLRRAKPRGFHPYYFPICPSKSSDITLPMR